MTGQCSSGEEMGKEETFNGMAAGISILGLYYQAAVQELGQEKAMKLYGMVGESFGAGNAQDWKQKFGDRTPSPKELGEAFRDMYNGFGFEISIKTEENKVTNIISKCPFYAGFMMAGLDHATIHKLCLRASNGEEKALKKAFPELDVFCEPRKSPDGFCVESYTINRP
jgi:hypothetical protein